MIAALHGWITRCIISTPSNGHRKPVCLAAVPRNGTTCTGTSSAIQAIGFKPEEVAHLIDAVGGAGLSICTATKDEASARALVNRVRK